MARAGKTCRPGVHDGPQAPAFQTQARGHGRTGGKAGRIMTILTVVEPKQAMS
jgi:hypothetical protein